VRACELALELTGDEALGVHWATLLMESSFGPISEGLGRASTLRHALSLLARFENFFTSEASFEVLESGDEVHVRVPAAATRSLRLRRFFAELSVAWHVSLMRAICPDLPIIAIAFAHDAPAYAAAYAVPFAMDVRFAQPWTEVRIAQAWFDAPRGSAGAQGAARVGAEGDGSADTSCSSRLHQLLVRRAPRRLSMPEAAVALGIGERSLRRRIVAEGHSFKEIEFRALAEVAKQMLLHEERSIEETASELGFPRVGAFRRAFKRWTGKTPDNLQAEARTCARR
jgi:AraC-like DNA-binding protein